MLCEVRSQHFFLGAGLKCLTPLLTPLVEEQHQLYTQEAVGAIAVDGSRPALFLSVGAGKSPTSNNHLRRKEANGDIDTDAGRPRTGSIPLVEVRERKSGEAHAGTSRSLLMVRY